MHTECQNQSGVTLVELLVVVAILGILGGISGLFLMKYLPEYHLRSASSALSQDLKSTQVNALRRLQTWSVTVTAGTDQTYTISSPSGTVKTVDLKNYGGEIRFQSIPTNPIQFNGEGIRSSTGSAIIAIRNNRGTVITTEVLRTGAIRVTR